MAIKLSTIKANPNNPRVIRDEKFEKLKKSITEFPKMMALRPMVVNADNIVLGGNMRLKALKELGYKEVPDEWIRNASELTQEEQRRFIIADNVGFGDHDWEVLQADWDLDELSDWGLDVPDWESEQLEAEEDNFDEAPPENPITVLGDLYEIGEHRLLCGDSTDSDQVAKLMNGEKADLGHNDPPYGMKKENEGVLNDNLNYSDLLNFNREWIALQFSHLKENGSWYCWGIDEPLMDIYSEILKPYIAQQKATFRNLITWDKGGFGSGGGTGVGQAIQRSYFPGDEKCLFVMMGVQGFNTNADNYFEGWEPIRLYLNGERKKAGFTTAECNKICGKTNMTQAAFTKGGFRLILREDYEKLREASNGSAFKREYDDIKREYDDIKREYYSTRAYFENTHDMMTNVWEFKRERNHDTGGHATPKPIALCERVVKSSCPENGLVVDFFLGSGSTMVASHQLKRKCYGMELDPKYCDVIVRRMLKLDPNIDVKRNGTNCKAEFV